MEVLKDTNELERIIKTNTMVLIEVGSESCNPCKALKSRISAWAENHHDIYSIYISIEENPEVAGMLSVLSAPTLLLYVEGRLTIREGGYFSLEEFLRKTERYENLLK